jgi:hypothetical protein
MAQTQKTRKQRQQRKAGAVRRIEVVLHSDAERDRAVLDHLDALPRGEASEWIRTTLFAAITARQAPDTPVPEPSTDTTATRQLEALISEVAALRQAVQQPIAAAAVSRPQEPVAIVNDVEATKPSSGLDMSRARRKRGPARTESPLPATEVEELPVMDAQDRLRILLTSTKQYGQEHQRAAAP